MTEKERPDDFREFESGTEAPQGGWEEAASVPPEEENSLFSEGQEIRQNAASSWGRNPMLEENRAENQAPESEAEGSAAAEKPVLRETEKENENLSDKSEEKGGGSAEREKNFQETRQPVQNPASPEGRQQPAAAPQAPWNGGQPGQTYGQPNAWQAPPAYGSYYDPRWGARPPYYGGQNNPYPYYYGNAYGQQYRPPVYPGYGQQYGYPGYGPYGFSPASQRTPPPPSDMPPAGGEMEEPQKKEKMNRKTKGFLWLIVVLLFLLVVGIAVYSIGRSAGWFGAGETPAPAPESTTSVPESTEEDKKLLQAEEIPQEGMLSPNQVYEKVKHSVVAVVTYSRDSQIIDSPIGSGSGIVLSEDGYIVTNSHVIGDSDQNPVKVVFTAQEETEEDKEYAAQIVGYDKRTDIAVLKIDAEGLVPAEFADSDQLKVGDTVLSLGNPGVAGENFTNTLTKGMVSALNRTVSLSSINMQYIQTDVAINPGSSGGALLNLYGQVVGINAAKITTTDIEGICFAIPTNIAEDVVNDIIANGYVSGRVRLGVVVREISEYEAELYNVPKGLVLREFSNDCSLPADGVKVGDIITAVNGVETGTTGALYDELEKYSPGDTVTLTIYRQTVDNERAGFFEVETVLLEDRGETQVPIE